MHDTFYLVVGQRWLWFGAVIAAVIAGFTSFALRRFAGGVPSLRRMLLASLAAPTIFLAIAIALVFFLAQQPATDWSELAFAAVLGAGLQAAILGLLCGLPIVLLLEWRRRR